MSDPVMSAGSYGINEAMRDGEVVGDQFIDGLEPCDRESPGEAYEANARRSAYIEALAAEVERLRILCAELVGDEGMRDDSSTTPTHR
jgi:hypothetical protein